MAKNRNTACPSSLERPPGKQCDEFPFASTWQGANTGGGNYSRRMINTTQNEDGGRALSRFYLYNPRHRGGQIPGVDQVGTTAED
ncbi:NucA/NucB deoxyribonuclease domain-containing protein [Streptomyces canus]|uniref:NucA/NucB deoxyribonuclease domain-containing protein n=1 Tax=Streptomyces canus TaxID=58343 RepID=UPI00386A62D1